MSAGDEGVGAGSTLRWPVSRSTLGGRPWRHLAARRRVGPVRDRVQNGPRNRLAGSETAAACTPVSGIDALFGGVDLAANAGRGACRAHPRGVVLGGACRAGHADGRAGQTGPCRAGLAAALGWAAGSIADRARTRAQSLDESLPSALLTGWRYISIWRNSLCPMQPELALDLDALAEGTGASSRVWDDPLDRGPVICRTGRGRRAAGAWACHCARRYKPLAVRPRLCRAVGRG